MVKEQGFSLHAGSAEQCYLSTPVLRASAFSRPSSAFKVRVVALSKSFRESSILRSSVPSLAWPSTLRARALKTFKSISAFSSAAKPNTRLIDNGYLDPGTR